jgi:hypothetical protein
MRRRKAFSYLSFNQVDDSSIYGFSIRLFAEIWVSVALFGRLVVGFGANTTIFATWNAVTEV